jgi:hypothetical protein
MATTDSSHNQIISLLGEIRGLLTSNQSNPGLDSLGRDIESLRSEMRNSFQQIIQLLSTSGSD